MFKKLKQLSRFEKISIVIIIFYLVIIAYFSNKLKNEREELQFKFTCNYCAKKELEQ